jgi:ketosteroid isomerase-like protein
MSQQDVELVRPIYEGWARGDFSETGVFDPEVEFVMSDWPHPGSARGVDGMNRMWQGVLSAWEDFRAEPVRFVDAGRSVLVFNHIHAVGRESRADVSADTATVWTLDEGRVVRLVLYWDTDKALAEAGLDE